MIALTKGRWLVFKYINHMIKCINDFYEYVKNIEEKCGNDGRYTYKSPCIMASDDHKKLKIVLNNCYDNYLLV